MTLIVETGWGLAGAESYATVAQADDYWTRFGGNAAWTVANTASKEVALRRASEFIDITYFPDRIRRVYNQGLMWPSAEDAFGYVPENLARATIMIAPYALTSSPLAAPAPEPFVTEATDRVEGTVTRTRKYAEPSRPGTVIAGVDIDFIRNLLGSLLGTHGGLVVGKRLRG